MILALCVSGRLIPLAEDGGKRVRNQKKIEFRTPPADRMCLLRPHSPPADRLRLFRPPPPADRMAPAQLIAAPQSNL